MTDDPPLVIDVRSRLEWEESRIEGSVNMALPQLKDRIGELPRDHALTVHCLAGYRSSVAASLLQRAGITDFTELVGGIGAWIASKQPTVNG